MRLVLLLCLLSLLVTPVFAESAKEIVRARKVMFDYARCVVKFKRVRAAEVVLANLSSEEMAKRYPDLIDETCMRAITSSVGMRFSGDSYLYALADALVNAEYAEEGAIDFADRLPLTHRSPRAPADRDADFAKLKTEKARTQFEESEKTVTAYAWLSRYGECVVRQDPVNARLWLLTPPDAPEEIGRINALKPAFAQCLDDGALSLTRSNLRGTVAVNYFRLANAKPKMTAGSAP